jgi:hypothetical protein
MQRSSRSAKSKKDNISSEPLSSSFWPGFAQSETISVGKSSGKSSRRRETRGLERPSTSAVHRVSKDFGFFCTESDVVGDVADHRSGREERDSRVVGSIGISSAAAALSNLNSSLPSSSKSQSASDLNSSPISVVLYSKKKKRTSPHAVNPDTFSETRRISVNPRWEELGFVPADQLEREKRMNESEVVDDTDQADKSDKWLMEDVGDDFETLANGGGTLRGGGNSASSSSLQAAYAISNSNNNNIGGGGGLAKGSVSNNSSNQVVSDVDADVAVSDAVSERSRSRSCSSRGRSSSSSGVERRSIRSIRSAGSDRSRDSSPGSSSSKSRSRSRSRSDSDRSGDECRPGTAAVVPLYSAGKLIAAGSASPRNRLNAVDIPVLRGVQALALLDAAPASGSSGGVQGALHVNPMKKTPALGEGAGVN